MFNLLLAGTLFYNLHNLASVGSTSTHTEITTNVNGNETKVVSDEPGTLKVTNINGEVTIEKNNEKIISSPVWQIKSSPSVSSSPVVFSKTEVLGVAQQEKINTFWNFFTDFFKNIKKIITGT